MPSNGLVELVERAALEEPILITSEVRELAAGLAERNLDYFFEFNQETRALEKGNKDRTSEDSKIYYARRLIAALCISAICDKREDGKPYHVAAVSYNKAGTSANLVAKSQDHEDERNPWLMRALIAKLRAASNSERGRQLKSALYSYVEGGISGTKILRSATRCVPNYGWPYEKIFCSVSACVSNARDLMSRGMSFGETERLPRLYSGLIDKAKMLGIID